MPGRTAIPRAAVGDPEAGENRVVFWQPSPSYPQGQLIAAIRLSERISPCSLVRHCSVQDRASRRIIAVFIPSHVLSVRVKRVPSNDLWQLMQSSLGSVAGRVSVHTPQWRW